MTAFDNLVEKLIGLSKIPDDTDMDAHVKDLLEGDDPREVMRFITRVGVLDIFRIIQARFPHAHDLCTMLVVGSELFQVTDLFKEAIMEDAAASEAMEEARSRVEAEEDLPVV